MRRYLLLIIKLYCALLLLFVAEKPLFMLLNASYGDGVGVGDYVAVMWHGLRLDMVAVCYLMGVTLLLLTVSVFVKRIGLRRLLSPWYMFVSIVVTLAFVADAVLYRSWGAKLDAFDISYTANPNDVFANFSFGILLLGVTVIALLVAGHYLLLRWLTPKEHPQVEKKWAAVAAGVLLMGVNVLGMRGGLDESTANPSYAYFSQQQYLNHAALNPLFNIIHSMGKQEDLAHEFAFYSEEELESMTQGLYASHPDVGDTLLKNRRPNVILVIWEGGGELMTGDPEVAPCFNRLKEEGVYFSNCYANNFRTDRGLVSILSGWPGLPTTSLMKMGGKCRNLPGLARSLKGAGYHTAFFYGGDIDFTNMRGYLYDTGFDQVEGLSEHEPNVPYDPSTDKWGIHDQYVLNYSYCSYPDKPWMVTYLTLSSHEPWTVPYHRLDRERENAFAYTDSCIGAFVTDLKQDGGWDNLLLVIVPDHGVARNGESLGDEAVARIPMLWIGGAVKEPGTTDVLMNQSDLAATLLAQMGIGAEDFVFSRNVTSRNYVPTHAVHAFKNGMNLIEQGGSTHFDCIDGQVVAVGKPHSPEAQSRAQALLQLIYQRSDAMMKGGR